METKELENALQSNPNRYIAYRNSDSSLNKVMDKDTGRLWFKVHNEITNEDKWSWIE